MTQKHQVLNKLIRQIDKLGPQVSWSDLITILEESDISLEDVAAFVETNQHNYNRAAIVQRQAYELLVMTWATGQGSVPHDHSGSVCVMKVIKGVAVEGSYDIASDGYVDLDHEEILEPGNSASLQDTGVHAIRNASSKDETLVTLHIYAPPLKSYRRFIPRPGVQGSKSRANKDKIPTIAIVGGGFSGAMTAAQLLKNASSEVRVILLERQGSIGEGVAYGTRDLIHLLNVPAGRMSAWPDRPNDFLLWAQKRKPQVTDADFLPRQWYGDYIRDGLLSLKETNETKASLSIIYDEVRRVVRRPKGGWILHVGRGDSIGADAVVLTVGHCPPSDPLNGKWSGSRSRFITDPWHPFAINKIRKKERILILGSGLSAIDAVLSLTQREHTGEIILVSLNGLLPQSHVTHRVQAENMSAFVSELTSAAGGVRVYNLLRNFRKKIKILASQGNDWRGAVDGLRPFMPLIWQSMSDLERQRFIHRVRPFWEIHRHRMAPEVSDKLQELIKTGQLKIMGGRVQSVVEENDEITARVLLKSNGCENIYKAHWIVNCTGPMPSNRIDSNPVIGSLLNLGLICVDELCLGIKTTNDGNAMDASGREVPDLFAIGTLRKPLLWESTAVPELREQAAKVAKRLIVRLGQ